MSWDIFSKSKIQYFLQKLKDKFVQKETGKGLSHNDFVANNAVLTTDKTPFFTRQTLNPTGFSGYVREKLIGASYAWNQQINLQDQTFSGDISGGVSNGHVTLTGTPSVSGNVNLQTGLSVINGHKYALLTLQKMPISANTSNFIQFYASGVFEVTIKENATNNAVIFEAPVTNNSMILRVRYQSGTTYNESFYPQLVDLTLAFGSTIADYLYGLSNNGGITKLRDMGCPIDKYTAYGNYLVSSKTSGKKIVGFNVWDEEWRLGKYNQSTGAYTSDNSQICNANKIKVLGGKTYYASVPTNKRFDYYEYDANDNFIKFTATLGGTFTLGENTAYINFTMGSAYGTTYNNDICINISETNKNGQYEPYCGYEISLGNDELRGKFDLVNGEIVASGDVKESNGGITRKYDIMDMGSMAWGYIEDGTFYTSSIAGSTSLVCSRYVFNDDSRITNNGNAVSYLSNGEMSYRHGTNDRTYVKNTTYTDINTFKTAMTGVYIVYELATPTTEQSTPFADPMSLVGATTEEYIDTRDIPCPVGAERQYMGQSNDIVEIPSSPQSDGKRYLKSIVSGGKQQFIWDENNMPFIPFIGNLIGNTFSALFYPANGATSFKLKVMPKGSTNTSMSCIIFSRYTVTAVTVAANSSNKIVQNQSAINMLVYGQSGSITLDFDTNNDYALIIGNSIYDSWCVIGFIRGGNNTFAFETIV